MLPTPSEQQLQQQQPPALGQAGPAAGQGGVLPVEAQQDMGQAAATAAAAPVAPVAPAKLYIPFSASTAALAAKQDKPLIQSSNLSAPVAASSVPTRTAVLFLGKDWERWHRYDRDSRLQLGWQPRGVASAVTDCRHTHSLSSSSSSSSDSAGSGSDDEFAKHAAVFSSDDEDDDEFARRMSGSQSSSAGQRSDNDVFSFQRRLTRRARLLSGTSTSTILENASSRPQSPAFFSPSARIRERRYSSNGPEAAFLRHETVIGIHTPRSPHSNSPASSSGYHTPSERKFSLAPLSQILPESSGSARSADGHQQQQRHQPSGRSNSTSAPTLASLQMSSSKTALAPGVAPTAPASSAGAIERATGANKLFTAHTNRTSSTQTVNPDRTPAARKISLVEGPARKKSQLSKSRNESSSSQVAEKSVKQQHHAAQGNRREKPSRSHSHNAARSGSARQRPHRIHLASAPRCPSKPVEGTLYDEEGPFVEGAVQDGLSVRIFNGYDDPCPQRERSRHENASGTDLGLHLDDGPNEQREQGTGVITYLITTPDNRVSSAAKLRRWAMDSDGNFYAAMEIKSVEAKLRAGGALPEATGMSFEHGGGAVDASDYHHHSRELIMSMQETYVEDIVLEIQKAQTLNPDRSTVSRLLETTDGKYVRLEEDYPEEAFFVLVGCEEFELYPVVALVFVEALRALARFHDAGWLHGDVKLENLMFDVQGRLVVIDYENANMFRKPRRRRQHHRHQHRNHQHHGQHRPREPRGASSTRRPGGGERSRPSATTIRSSSPSSSRREARAEHDETNTRDSLSAGGKVHSRSSSSSPGPRRLALDAVGVDTDRTGAGDSLELPPGDEAESEGFKLGLGLQTGTGTGMAREDSRASSQVLYADDEAEASDEDEDDEHLVRLISYDWTPPEANLSPWTSSYQSTGSGNVGGHGTGLGAGGDGGGGRMMGPSGDLWALGCNLIRAFALRDGMPDVEVREILLGTGQRAFFKHRASVLASLQKAKDGSGGGDDGVKAAEHAGTPVATADAVPQDESTEAEPPSTPASRVLYRFSQEAPKLMHFVLARCVTPFPSERGWEAELEGLALAEELERERIKEPIPASDLQGSAGQRASLNGASNQPPLRKVDAEDEEPPLSHIDLSLPTSGTVLTPTAAMPSNVSLDGNGAGPKGELPLLMDVAQAAILKAISMSGSMWVRPKLEEARRSLGLGGCGINEYGDCGGYGYGYGPGEEEDGPPYGGEYGGAYYDETSGPGAF
ncbi:hypothetical protein CF336_g3370 [Tilletia laevis]|nr:hypothetical protein CF336_g3370 [Tilletia laevis]